MKPVLQILFLFAVLGGVPAHGREYAHMPAENIPGGERALNFTYMYLTQWVGYAITQKGNIEDHGDVRNLWKNPIHPHFDKDSFDYNLILHPLVGNYYYLFYRSRRYNEVDSFFWTFTSSLAFEFAIETLTERPSIQDIYQTPVLGTLMGMGLERLSNALHSLDAWPARALGYVINPYTIFPFSRYGFKAEPIFEKNRVGAALRLRF